MDTARRGGKLATTTERDAAPCVFVAEGVMNPWRSVDRICLYDARVTKRISWSGIPSLTRCAVSYLQKRRTESQNVYRVRRTHRNAVTSTAVVIETPSFPPSVSATWLSEDGGWTRGLLLATTVAARDRNHRIQPRGQSRFHRRNALYTHVVRSHLYSPHHTRTCASTLDTEISGFVATAHGSGPRNAEEESFFSGSTRAAESMCDVTLPNCLFWFCGCVRD